MILSTLTPRSRPSIFPVPGCMLELPCWCLPRELDWFLWPWPSENPRAGRLEDSLALVMVRLTGTNPDDGPKTQTGPPQAIKGGSGKSIVLFSRQESSSIFFPEIIPAGALIAPDSLNISINRISRSGSIAL
jgi:hypothetical protein